MIVPGIADDELRRELIRAGKLSGLRRLDAVRAGFEVDPMTDAALDKAAELRAAVRNAGLTTAHPAALDGEAILAARTILAADAGELVTIATNNARQLSRFPGIDARTWQSLTPDRPPARRSSRNGAELRNKERPFSDTSSDLDAAR